MAKFIITFSDKDNHVEVTAKTHGNESMKEPTDAQDLGALTLSFVHALQEEDDTKGFWESLKELFGGKDAARRKNEAKQATK